MKKLMILVMVMFMLFVGIAVGFSKTTLDLDGYAWNSISNNSKEGLVYGLSMASGANKKIASYLEEQGKIDKDVEQVFIDINDYPHPINFMIRKITEYYENTMDWEKPIYEVFYTIFGNTKKTNLEEVFNSGKDKEEE